MMKSYALKNGEIMTIRIATKKDALAFIEYLHKIACQSDYLTFTEDEIKVTLEQQELLIETSANADNCLYACAEVNGNIVGILNFNGGNKKRTRHVGEFGVSILFEYWGLGIGSCLIEYMIDWAKTSNVIRKINLRMRSDNAKALSLYLKFKFIQQGIFTKDLCIDGQFYDSILMGLEII